MRKERGKSDSEATFGRAAFLLSDNGSVDFTNGSVVTDANGLWVRGMVMLLRQVLLGEEGHLAFAFL